MRNADVLRFARDAAAGYPAAHLALGAGHGH